MNMPVSLRLDTSIDYAFKYDVDELANTNYFNINVYFNSLESFRQNLK